MKDLKVRYKTELLEEYRVARDYLGRNTSRDIRDLVIEKTINDYEKRKELLKMFDEIYEKNKSGYVKNILKDTDSMLTINMPNYILESTIDSIYYELQRMNSLVYTDNDLIYAKVNEHIVMLEDYIVNNLNKNEDYTDSELTIFEEFYAINKESVENRLVNQRKYKESDMQGLSIIKDNLDFLVAADLQVDPFLSYNNNNIIDVSDEDEISELNSDIKIYKYYLCYYR